MPNSTNKSLNYNGNQIIMNATLYSTTVTSVICQGLTLRTKDLVVETRVNENNLNGHN